MQVLKEKLRLYILENFLFTDDQSELNDDDSFVEREDDETETE